MDNCDKAKEQLIDELQQEIIELKRTEVELRLINAYNRGLIEASLDPLVTIDPDGRISDVNAATENFTGYSRDDLIGKSFSDYFTDPEKAKEGYQKVFTNGAVQDYELEIRHRDGHVTPVLYNATVYKDESDNVIGVFAAARDITKQKQAEELQLRDSEEKYRNLFENAPGGMYRSKLDGSGFIAINKKLIEIFGYSEGEMLAEPSTIRWENPDERKVMVQRLQENGILTDYEVNIVTKSREIKTCIASITLYPKQGYLEGTIVDITDRKKIEMALQQSERELYIKNKIVYIFLTFPDDEVYGEILRFILEAMESEYGVFGYIDENGDLVCPSMVGNVMEQCNIPDKDIIFPHETWGNGIWVRALGEKKLLYSNEPSILPEGHLPIARNISAPIIYQGNVIGLLQVANKSTDYDEKDIKIIETIANHVSPVLSARLQREIQEKMRKKAKEELIKSEQLYRSAIESANAIPYIRNSNSDTYEFMGTGIKSLTGYDTNEYTPKIYDSTVQEIIVCGDFANLPENEAKRKFYEQEDIILREEVRIKTRDGKEKWLIDSRVIMPNLEEGSNKSLGILQDITDLKQAEESLKQRVEELARSNAELEQFAYVSSHDLQEPLRKIQAFGDLLKTRYNNVLDERGQDYIQRMQDAAGRMQTLINDLLTYSRVTTKSKPYSTVNLGDVLREVISNLEAHIQQTGGSVEIGDMPTIDAEQMQMYQLLQNLISNGLKFHRPDEPPVVKVHGEIHEGICSIFVEDNGIGFDEQYLDRIFVIFQRLHGRFEYEGTGVGLAICRKIVERHGGSITAKSKPGKGSTFIVTLPIKQDKGGSNV
jgi:PAS domain S-box-containing protein